MNLNKFVINLNKTPSFWISAVRVLEHEPVRESDGTPTQEIALSKRNLKRLVFSVDYYTSFDCEIIDEKRLKIIWNIAHTAKCMEHKAFSKLKHKNYKAGKYISFRTFREIVKKSCALTYPGAK